MGLVLVLLLLALVFGGAGIFVGGMKILLVVGLVLLIASMFSGYRYRSSR